MTDKITVSQGTRSAASIVVRTLNVKDVTTSDVAEGTNLYFTNTRVVSSLTAGGNITIDANGRINSTVTSSSNYTNSNTYANVSLIGYATTTNVALKANIRDLTTANVVELTNLYFTNARAIGSLTAGGNITIDANGRINSTATGGGGSSTYGDSNVALLGYATNANVATKANIADLTTANVTELTNLYFTNARAIAAVTNTTLSNLTASGNVIATNFVGSGSGLTGVALKTSNSWIVTTGTNIYSFTVPASGTYQLWVECNIPNGILVWNATATFTNSNVPVVGTHYAWVYNGGGSPVDFTSIPNQFTGTANTIIRSSGSGSLNTNKFEFGINNTSGGNVTVRYGWVTIS